MMNDVPHGKGVLVFGNGLGGGIQKAGRADRCACERLQLPLLHSMCPWPRFSGNTGCSLGSDCSCCRRRRYEGEFDSGFAHGMGQYTSTKGKVRLQACNAAQDAIQGLHLSSLVSCAAGCRGTFVST